jgi:hypothetical protein
VQRILDWLGIFFLADLFCGIVILLLVWGVNRSRKAENRELIPIQSWAGAIGCLAVALGLVYAGIWMCLRTLDE